MTRSKATLTILSVLLGDYRLSDPSSNRKGAVLSWTSSQIVVNTGIPRRTVNRVLAEMLEFGIIEKRGQDYKIASRILWNLFDYQNQFNKEKERALWLKNQTKN